MYNVGDFVIYGKTGVCKVVDITTPKNRLMDHKRLYYVLEHLYQSDVIYVPVDTDIFMRPIISEEEVNELIDLIPMQDVPAYHSRSIQMLSDHYESAFNTHNCLDLIELLMSISTKRDDAESQNKKLGQTDEKFMKQAENLLYGEFSVALGIPKDDVEQYIKERIEQNV